MWTDERDAVIRELWRSIPASAIAARFGDVTRNAVIGRAHRLGLAAKTPMTRSEAARIGGKASVAAARAARRAKTKIETKGKAKIVRDLFRAAEFPADAEPVQSLPDLVPTVFRVADLEHHHCRWPGAEIGHSCGRNKVEGLPYCPEHARRAYAGAPPPPLKKVYGGVNRYARQRALAEAGF